MLDELEKDGQNDWEDELAKQIATVEYYYGVFIGFDYPLLKRLNQMEQLNYMFELDAKRNGLMQ